MSKSSKEQINTLEGNVAALPYNCSVFQWLLQARSVPYQLSLVIIVVIILVLTVLPLLVTAQPASMDTLLALNLNRHVGKEKSW